MIVRRFAGGERSAILVDEHGVPLSLPTLYATVRLRNAGIAFNSIKNKLNELKVLLRWERAFKRDLEAEFRSATFLALSDVIAIRDFAAVKVQARAGGVRPAGRISDIAEAMLSPVRSLDKVSKQVHYNRLTTISDYLEFVGQVVNSHSGKSAVAAIDLMAKQLRSHRPRGMSSYQDDDPEKLSPSSELIEAFVRVGSEGHPENPFRDGSIQRRNELIFRLLYETGIRRGELLSLRLDCIQTGHEACITIKRTHDDEHDSRNYQPVAKTKERVLPISDESAASLHKYCMEDRATAKGSNRHPYLFVTHRRGATCGQPMSMASLGGKVFGAMQRARPEFADIHPHSFRHHMNYVISKHVDDRNQRARSDKEYPDAPISEGRELDIRAHLNGHRSVKSGAAYNRRHVREKSDMVAREVQQELASRVRRLGADHNE